MDFNLIKKVKVENISVPRLSSNLDDELNSGKKLITKLNRDCLAEVLMHLSVLDRLEMENVSQKWQQATELSWHNIKKLDFKDFMISLDKKGEIMNTIMIKCGRFLRHLIINDAHLNYPWKYHVLLNNCQNIIHFDIEMRTQDKYTIPEGDLVQIIQSMKKLKYLRVSINIEGSINLCNEIVATLSSDINEIHLITSSSYLNGLKRVAPALNKFDSLNCLTLKKFYLTKETFESLLQNKNTLSKLDLSECIFPSGESLMFTNLKNLEQLILLNVDDFNENEILSIAHNCSKLKHFDFTNDNKYGQTIKLPYRIFSELKYLNLEHLNVSSVDESISDDAGNRISQIANNWKGLKHLNVDKGLAFSQLDIQEITKFKNLQYLNIDRANIDSQSFINIVSNCLELKNFLINLRNLPETALEELKNLKKLERLNFADCKNLTGNVLTKIVNNCENLVHLYLAGCKNLTEDSLIQVGKLKNLITLDISRIKNVPNAMFDHFHNLDALICNKCSSIGDKNIIKVLDNCRKLSYLEVTKAGITDKSLIHASNRQLVFKPLFIYANFSLVKRYMRINSTSTPYLTIYG